MKEAIIYLLNTRLRELDKQLEKTEDMEAKSLIALEIDKIWLLLELLNRVV